MIQNRNGFSSALIVLVIALLIVGGIWFASMRKNSTPENKGTEAMVAKSGETVVMIGSSEVSPQMITVSAGQRVRFQNNDSKAHTLAGPENVFQDIDALQSGQSMSLSFDTPGTYSYHDSNDSHLWGTVVVQ